MLRVRKRLSGCGGSVIVSILASGSDSLRTLSIPASDVPSGALNANYGLGTISILHFCNIPGEDTQSMVFAMVKREGCHFKRDNSKCD